MSLDLAYDEGQGAILDALGQFCAERCSDEVVKASEGAFPTALWRELAQLGVLAAGTPDGDGGALEVCAAMEALGRAVFPGPLPATFLAGQVLRGSERANVLDGAAIVSVGVPPLMPWACDADVFIEIEEDALHRGEPRGAIEPVTVLGGEPWGRLALQRVERLPDAERGLALGECALAAYLAAAGLRLVADASEHARTRQQFGKPIGEFQAVAHPLAAAYMRLEAASTLARAAAWRFDLGEIEAAREAAATARLSASAASIGAVHVAHQVFGAIGITLEGPAYHVTRRIRQLAAEAPGDAAARQRVLTGIGLGPAAAGEAT